ncbi:MAG: hypothetical protein CM15mP112_06850 [Flavobacteriales bacterium]|nr:MAG: hypothetical protein CM15mP112_06850 [Flavobacteriales bacterium]
MTNLCASVATKTVYSLDNSQYTPDITGRSSSFPLANNVLLIAFNKTEEFILILFDVDNEGVFGKSSPFCPAVCNFQFQSSFQL